MTATAKTKPAADAPAEEPQQWTPPQVCIGQTVVFYYRGVRSRPGVAQVSIPGETAIGVVHRGQGYGEVLHINDPRLKTNPDLLASIDGLWEESTHDVQLRKRLEAIEARLDAIEAANAKY